MVDPFLKEMCNEVINKITPEDMAKCNLIDVEIFDITQEFFKELTGNMVERG